MADVAFGGVEKLVKVALAIKEAVETVKQNDKECRAIGKCATRCTALLARLAEQTDTMKDEVMRAPLEDVAESLEEALELVKLCQRKHYFSRLWKAADMAKELRRVQDDILRKVQVGDFATTIQATVMLTDIKNARFAPPPQPLLERPPLSLSWEVIPGFTQFSLHDLRTATDNFSEENIIGRGGSTTVYKGVLHDGQVVAIKKMLDTFIEQHEVNLYDGINIFLKLKHKNIIRPLGYCHEIVVGLGSHGGKYVGAQDITFCFVEEYMPKGSMRSFRKGIIRESPLIDWSTRFHIVKGIAQGLCYVHEQRVVHSDLKPENILLDSDMIPRINDFGLATKLVHVDDEITRDDSIEGTPGYMTPEYLGEGIVSIKGDMYAFGLILFETIGIMNRFKSPARRVLLWWAEVVQDAGRLKELFGPAKVGQPQLMEIKRCIEVGLLCRQYDRHKRPTMVDVLLMLNGEKEIIIPEEGLRFSKRSLRRRKKFRTCSRQMR